MDIIVDIAKVIIGDNMRFLAFSILIFLFSCASKQTDLIYINLSEAKYEKTDIKSIEIVENRLELKRKYQEIGVLKIPNDYPKDQIKNFASKIGADVILFEANNAIFIKYLKTEKREEIKHDEIKA